MTDSEQKKSIILTIGDDIVLQCKEEKLLRLEQRIDNRPTIKCK